MSHQALPAGMKDEVERALAAVQAKAATWAGPCSQCVHCKPFSSLSFDPSWDKCANPVETALAFSPAAGFANKEALPNCNQARARDGRCGPDGRFFEARAAARTKGWLARLFG